MCARGVFQTNAQTANAKQSVELVSTHAGGEYAHACLIKTQIIYMLVSSKAAPLISTEIFRRSECSGCISKRDELTFATAKKCD